MFVCFDPVSVFRRVLTAMCALPSSGNNRNTSAPLGRMWKVNVWDTCNICSTCQKFGHTFSLIWMKSSVHTFDGYYTWINTWIIMHLHTHYIIQWLSFRAFLTDMIHLWLFSVFASSHSGSKFSVSYYLVTKQQVKTQICFSTSHHLPLSSGSISGYQTISVQPACSFDLFFVLHQWRSIFIIFSLSSFRE